MIKNGDTVINSSGSTVLLEGLDAKFQQAVICISAKLGAVSYTHLTLPTKRIV